ncbi:hypothetical protein [Nocardia vinacea]|nr:hypothetical protein [Nocardia vinacea]
MTIYQRMNIPQNSFGLFDIGGKFTRHAGIGARIFADVIAYGNSGQDEK